MFNATVNPCGPYKMSSFRGSMRNALLSVKGKGRGALRHEDQRIKNFSRSPSRGRLGGGMRALHQTSFRKYAE